MKSSQQTSDGEARLIVGIVLAGHCHRIDKVHPADEEIVAFVLVVWFHTFIVRYIFGVLEKKNRSISGDISRRNQENWSKLLIDAIRADSIPYHV